MKPYIFPSLAMLVALAIAAGAALFTVLGFRELFEPSLKIMYMAAVIEVGKVMAVSALYQFRDIIGWAWKSVLFILIIIAMAVTSMGVYGYLASSYQKDTLAITQNDARIELMDSRRERLEQRLENIDAQIAEVPETYVSKRMELIATFAPEKESVVQELDQLAREESEIKLERIEQQTEFGAILLLAESVDWLDPTNAMLYFILAVIFIFDPMAVVLTYVANVGFANISNKKQQEMDIDTINSVMGQIKSDQVDITDALTKALEKVDSIQSPSPNSRSGIIDSMRKQED
jgi:hypothetical protein